MSFDLVFYFGALIIGLGLLWFAGGLSVSYSIKISDIFNLNKLFIGFVLVSVVTGIPELAVIVVSLFKGHTLLPAATILGSNVSDISFVLGLPILIYGGLKISEKDSRDSLFMLFVTIVTSAIIFIGGSLNWILGVVLVFTYFFTIWYIWRTTAKKEALEEEKVQEKIVAKDLSLKVSSGRGQRQKPGRVEFKQKVSAILIFLSSLLFVLVASEFVVRIAIIISEKLNINEYVIGVTILAIGTSLPELTVSLSAMRKREYALAIGNSLGSVLEQGTLLLGLLAIFSKKPVNLKVLYNIVPFMFFAFILIFVEMIFRKRIGRVSGGLMLLSFITFLIYQVLSK